MAAALIPLIAGLAPQIIDAIVGFIHKAAPEVEAANGPQTGPIKFGQLFQMVSDGIAAGIKAGQFPGVPPTDDQVKLIMQVVVTSMQMVGKLGAQAVVSDAVGTIPTVAAQTLTLKAGQSITVLVAP